MLTKFILASTEENDFGFIEFVTERNRDIFETFYALRTFIKLSMNTIHESILCHVAWQFSITIGYIIDLQIYRPSCVISSRNEFTTRTNLRRHSCIVCKCRKILRRNIRRCLAIENKYVNTSRMQGPSSWFSTSILGQTQIYVLELASIRYPEVVLRFYSLSLSVA